MKRTVIEFFTYVMALLGRRKRLSLGEMKGLDKVNLGCGLAIAPNWVNVDGSLNAILANLPPFLGRLAYNLSGANRYYSFKDYAALLYGNFFVHHDLAHSIPIQNDQVKHVYSSHFLEHLSKEQAMRLLRETYRVLRPGGVVRIVVPDLEYAIALYPQERRRMLDNYFFVQDQGSKFAQHRYMYDFDSLKEVLESVGFKDIRRCAFRQGDTPDLEGLDNREEESLFVEANKA